MSCDGTLLFWLATDGDGEHCGEKDRIPCATVDVSGASFSMLPVRVTAAATGAVMWPPVLIITDAAWHTNVINCRRWHWICQNATGWCAQETRKSFRSSRAVSVCNCQCPPPLGREAQSQCGWQSAQMQWCTALACSATSPAKEK